MEMPKSIGTMRRRIAAKNQESRGGGDVHGRRPCGEALEVREA